MASMDGIKQRRTVLPFLIAQSSFSGEEPGNAEIKITFLTLDSL